MRKKLTTEKIMSLIFSIGRVVRKQTLEEGKKRNSLSVLQIETLRLIRHNREIFMKDLAGCLFITPPSATSLVDDLVKKKLVARTADKEDRRIIKVHVAVRGKRALSNYSKRKLEKIRKKIDLLSANEKRSLLKILEKLAAEDNQLKQSYE